MCHELFHCWLILPCVVIIGLVYLDGCAVPDWKPDVNLIGWFLRLFPRPARPCVVAGVRGAAVHDGLDEFKVDAALPSCTSFRAEPQTPPVARLSDDLEGADLIGWTLRY